MWVRLFSPLAEEARHPTVGQHLSAGLARRAIRDLVALVRHAPEVVPAPRARRAVPVVDHEPVAQLRGEAARTGPLAGQGLGQDVADRLQEGGSLVRRE